MSGLKTLCMAFLLLVLWGGTKAAGAAPSVTPLTMNGAPVSSAITQPGEWKWFSFVSNLPDSRYVTIEVIHGTLMNYEFAYQTSTSGWPPSSYDRVSSEGALYSTKMFRSFDYTVTRYIIVRALDGKSTGSFSIHVMNGSEPSNFRINNGAVSTPYSNVDLNYTFNYSTPSGFSFLYSESPDFKDASWQSFAYSFKYRLSPGTGLKTVYLKMRDAKGTESAVYADTIYVNQLQNMALNGLALNGTVAVSGEEVCFPFTITAQGRYRIETTTLTNGPATARLYGSGLNLSDAPVSGQANIREIKADIPPGSYVAKVKAATLPCTFSIRLTYDGSVSSFAINNNASDTTSRLVTLTSVVTNSPTHYKASIYYGFDDALWMPYASTVPFKLNGGSGLKTVYFKVKYANGSESETKVSKINLNDLLTLVVDDDWIMGNIVNAGAIDTYLLTITTAGRYTIESRCGTMKDTLLILYRQDDPKNAVAQDDDSGRNYAARIDTPLAPGTYLVKITTSFLYEWGSYSVRVKKN